MLSLLAPQEGPDFPVLWWLWWFVVAFGLYGLLGVWFWTSMRRGAGAAANRGQAKPAHQE